MVDPSGAIVHCNRKWEETARIGMLSSKELGWMISRNAKRLFERNLS